MVHAFWHCLGHSLEVSAAAAPEENYVELQVGELPVHCRHPCRAVPVNVATIRHEDQHRGTALHRRLCEQGRGMLQTHTPKGSRI